MKISYSKITTKDIPTIFNWLQESFIQEFWDNTKAHKDDIINFAEGRKTPSTYADGKYVYWLAKDHDQPFALIMTIQETSIDDINQIKLNHLSKTGTSYGLDYMIGNQSYFGKGYGASTLSQFIEFFRTEIDNYADTFIIDPEENNPKATHVYQKAGFTYIADFIMEGQVSGAGKKHHLLIKKFPITPRVEPATLNDYPTIQNMARFYVYDLSRECGHTSNDWAIPADGLYESFDFKCYFEDKSREAFIIKVRDEIAGFVLLNRNVVFPSSDWNIGEFFILAKFQKRGIAKQVAEIIWQTHPGKWEVTVLPDNKSALNFWENTISTFTNNDYVKEIKIVYPQKPQPKRYLFTFNSKI